MAVNLKGFQFLGKQNILTFVSDAKGSSALAQLKLQLSNTK